MDYIRELSRIRDKMHQEIICTMIADNHLEPNEYEIEFKNPIECTVTYHRPTIHNPVEDVIITGIDSNSSEPIAITEDGNDRFISYSDFKLEDLALVHRTVISKNYFIKQLELC